MLYVQPLMVAHQVLLSPKDVDVMDYGHCDSEPSM